MQNYLYSFWVAFVWIQDSQVQILLLELKNEDDFKFAYSDDSCVTHNDKDTCVAHRSL